MAARTALLCLLCLPAAIALAQECEKCNKADSDTSITALFQTVATVTRHELGRAAGANELKPQETMPEHVGGNTSAMDRNDTAMSGLPFFWGMLRDTIMHDHELSKEVSDSETLSAFLREMTANPVSTLTALRSGKLSPTITEFGMKVTQRLQQKGQKAKKITALQDGAQVQAPKSNSTQTQFPMGELSPDKIMDLVQKFIDYVSTDPELKKEVENSEVLSAMMKDVAINPMTAVKYMGLPEVQQFGFKVFHKFVTSHQALTPADKIATGPPAAQQAVDDKAPSAVQDVIKSISDTQALANHFDKVEEQVDAQLAKEHASPEAEAMKKSGAITSKLLSTVWILVVAVAKY